MTPDPRPHPGRIEGERRRDAAHANLRAHCYPLIVQAQRALVEAALRKGWATADDVRDVLPEAAGRDPRVFGPVPADLARAGIIRADDRPVRSRRPEAHGRWITRWVLNDAAAARRWLAAHPDPDAPEAGGTLAPAARPPDPAPAPRRKSPALERGAEAAGGGGEADEDRTAADAPAPVGPGLFDFDGAKGVARGA